MCHWVFLWLDTLQSKLSSGQIGRALSWEIVVHCRVLEHQATGQLGINRAGKILVNHFSAVHRVKKQQQKTCDTFYCPNGTHLRACATSRAGFLKKFGIGSRSALFFVMQGKNQITTMLLFLADQVHSSRILKLKTRY